MAKFGYHDKRLCGFAQNVNHHIGIQKEPVIINLRGVNEMASDYYTKAVGGNFGIVVILLAVLICVIRLVYRINHKKKLQSKTEKPAGNSQKPPEITGAFDKSQFKRK